jgi:hypothetical protein
VIDGAIWWFLMTVFHYSSIERACSSCVKFRNLTIMDVAVVSLISFCIKKKGKFLMLSRLIHGMAPQITNQNDECHGVIVCLSLNGQDFAYLRQCNF